ncbi:hypothetical protein [Pararhizobium mangrovi]|uniref:hypothetical protein n=1 Tax=Pararhizobium mangrovi TaxID=2590452 RepID=UPI00113209C0|nr:hypothetical protein [Pararhizobium mangrovi]
MVEHLGFSFFGYAAGRPSEHFPFLGFVFYISSTAWNVYEHDKNTFCSRSILFGIKFLRRVDRRPVRLSRCFDRLAAVGFEEDKTEN